MDVDGCFVRWTRCLGGVVTLGSLPKKHDHVQKTVRPWVQLLGGTTTRVNAPPLGWEIEKASRSRIVCRNHTDYEASSNGSCFVVQVDRARKPVSETSLSKGRILIKEAG